jgi:hypothetical protein
VAPWIVTALIVQAVRMMLQIVVMVENHHDNDDKRSSHSHNNINNNKDMVKNSVAENSFMMAVLYIGLTMFFLVIPAWQYRLQKYKRRIHGPWDIPKIE